MAVVLVYATSTGGVADDVSLPARTLARGLAGGDPGPARLECDGAAAASHVPLAMPFAQVGWLSVHSGFVEQSAQTQPSLKGSHTPSGLQLPASLQ